MRLKRRQLILLGYAWIVAQVSAHGAPMINVDSPLPWLQITASTNPQFDSKVSAAVGTRTNVVPAISQVLPYSVVITNAGNETVIAVDIRFSLKFPTRTVTRNYFYHSFSHPE